MTARLLHAAIMITVVLALFILTFLLLPGRNSGEMACRQSLFPVAHVTFRADERGLLFFLIDFVIQDATFIESRGDMTTIRASA